MKKIPLTQGKFALIDNRDYWLVRQFKWCAHKARRVWYASTNIRMCGVRKVVKMHRLLAGFPPFDIDHKNGDGLDNQRRNLRPATRSQNQANCGPRQHNTSGYKGVCWDNRQKKWLARVQFCGKERYLGRFANLKNAAAAYKKATTQLNGEFARI